MDVLVINGPNLDLLGTREPEIYGSMTLPELEQRVVDWGAGMGVAVETMQVNDEAKIIEAIHTFSGDGLVINPAALSHTSRAIADALTASEVAAVEVHISNIWERESWRAKSVVSAACVRTIYGRGLTGYRDGLRHLVNRAATEYETVRYGPHPDNVGDLRRGTSNMLIVLAHGGLWRHEYERDTTESLAVDLTQRGFHTWNLEYRRKGKGGGWPASGHDLMTALDFIPQLGLDVGEVLAVTHSAGSQLMAWAAPRSATTIGLHVALGALLDLGAVAATGEVGSAETAQMVVEGAAEDTTTGHIPTILVHGEADQIVPADHVRAYAKRHGLELHMTDTDHFSLLDPSSPEWTWVVDRMAKS